MTTFNILDFGAVGDGQTNDAKAIQRAMDTCNASGGGRVIVPAGGRFVTGPFKFKSHVEMHLEPNATLIASTDESLYTENSVVLVQIDIPGAPLPLRPPIQITIPFDSDDVEPGDFRAGIAVVYHAANPDDLRTGTNVTAVRRSDIVYEDHTNGLVCFLVLDLSAFGAGGAQPVAALAKGKEAAYVGGGGGG